MDKLFQKTSEQEDDLKNRLTERDEDIYVRNDLKIMAVKCYFPDAFPSSNEWMC